MVNAILETGEGFVIAQIGETVPAGVTPLEDVVEPVKAFLIRREAEKKSEEAARAVVAQFANGVPAAYKDKIVTSAPFTRRGDVPNLGLSKPLGDAVFAAPLEKWLPEPFATPKGAVIAMPVETIPLTADEWAKLEPRAVEIIMNAQRGQLLNAFVSNLQQKAEIVISDMAKFQ